MLGGALSGKQATPPAPLPHKEEGLLSKLGDALGGKQNTPPPPPSQPATFKQDMVQKLTEAVVGKPAPPPEKHGLVQQLAEVAIGKQEPGKHGLVQQLTEAAMGKQQAVPEKPHGLVNKLNHALGGGAKGEAEEGRLDKAIDLFQEYVLKEGPQHNESALEQAKDKQIAETIKNAMNFGSKK